MPTAPMYLNKLKSNSFQNHLLDDVRTLDWIGYAL